MLSSTIEMSSANLRTREARFPAPHVTPVVFVVEDDVSVRESLELLIRSAGWEPKIFASAQEFLSLPRTLVPSCMILDVYLPDFSGLDLQKRVADRLELPIIFITGYDDVPLTVRAMKAGALEFLRKPLVHDALLNAICDAFDRSQAAINHEAEMQILRNRYAALSRREREVMALVVSGCLNKQTGAKLGISEITVKAHRGKVMRKMGAHCLVGLIHIAGKLRAASAPKTDATGQWFG
jgi:FixJ family two-component response regulator